jgi:hypothetical protein
MAIETCRHGLSIAVCFPCNQGERNTEAIDELKALVSDIQDGLFDIHHTNVRASKDKIAWTTIYRPGDEFMSIQIVGKVHFHGGRENGRHESGADNGLNL